jgi:hypothetical protein
MRKVLLGVMLSLLTIATCFVTSCTKVNNYGPSAPRFETNDSVKVTVLAPTDFEFPLSGEVTVSVLDESGAQTSYQLDEMWPQWPDGNSTEYVGYISTTSTTSFITVRYCSVNLNIHKTLSGQYELSRKIKL